jgi:hypothetical protein
MSHNIAAYAIADFVVDPELHASDNLQLFFTITGKELAGLAARQPLKNCLTPEQISGAEEALPLPHSDIEFISDEADIVELGKRSRDPFAIVASIAYLLARKPADLSVWAWLGLNDRPVDESTHLTEHHHWMGELMDIQTELHRRRSPHIGCYFHGDQFAPLTEPEEIDPALLKLATTEFFASLCDQLSVSGDTPDEIVAFKVSFLPVAIGMRRPPEPSPV